MPRKRLLLMHWADNACTMIPTQPPPCKRWCLGLSPSRGSTRPTNTSPRGLSGQSSPRNKPLCALLVQGKLPHHQLQTQTHAHLRLSYGAPVCRVKADSCGPLVRAVGVAPKCRQITCMLHGRGSKDFTNLLWLDRYIHTWPGKGPPDRKVRRAA